MTSPSGSGTSQVQSGTPSFQINNVAEAPIHEDRPLKVETGQPVIEITCSICGQLTSRTYPIEVNGVAVSSAPNEKYPCSCPSP